VGCSGIIYVLVERITCEDDCPASSVRRVVTSRQSMTTATVYQSDLNGHKWVGRRFHCPSEFPSAWVTGKLTSVLSRVESDHRPVCCELALADGSLRMLIESIQPPRPLWIFGAGDDAIPLAVMADQLGWAVTVVDHQASRLTGERFPNASLVCEPWNSAVERLSPSRRTAAVLMTHSLTADRILLPRLLDTSVGYVGVLGPKSRTGRMIEQLYAAGAMPDFDSLDRLHTPLGLDIGASIAPEIAVAIVGEIIALDNGRNGGSLQQRQAPIHEPVRHELIDLVSVYEDTSSP
ncbi:MAG: XdhC family protein, partial [Planctomycetota bacterium]